MNKYSRIEQAKNLVFQWKASNTDQSEITQILQSAPNGQSVGLKAKVLFKGDKETVYSKHAKKNLTKYDIVVADTTGAITVTLWESQIAEVEQHSCYHFKELKLNWYKKKYLGSSTKTTIEKCENIDIPGGITSETENIKPHEKAKKKITGTIIASAPGYNIDKNIDHLSANIMEETVLNVSNLCFQVIMDDKIVKSIELGGAD